MMRMLGKYRNGDYDVSIYEDGTKIRDNGDGGPEDFHPEFPESIDLNITDWCDVGCPFCYRSCTTTGRHADFSTVTRIIGQMHPWTEVALGGGSPVLYPQLEGLLEYAKVKDVIANITVHNGHVMNKGIRSRLVGYCRRGLLHGVGVSCQGYESDLQDAMQEINDAGGSCVQHVIAGVIYAEELENLIRLSKFPILILGYKQLGRGSDSTPTQGLQDCKDVLAKLMRGGEAKATVCFDNLAIEQLGMKELVGDEFPRLYMGDDGVSGQFTSASMYIDAVTDTFAVNSLQHGRIHPCGTYSVKEMFQVLLKEMECPLESK